MRISTPAVRPSTLAFTRAGGMLWLCFCILCIALLCTTQARAQQQSLNEIRAEINKRQQNLTSRMRQADQLQAQLKQDELHIAASAGKLAQTRQDIVATTEEIAQLERRQQALSHTKSAQQALLGKQLRSAYVSGKYDYAKLLFFQGEAGKMERMLSYYQYLNQARKDTLHQLISTLADLERVNESLQHNLAKQQRLADTIQAQAEALEKQQASRKRTLNQIAKQISSTAAIIEELEFNQQSLLLELDKAQRQAARVVNLKGLKGLKGKLRRPTKGRLRNLFGGRRQGQVRWKGVLFSGDEGTPVYAIHQGKVLFSDWLRGFGLVTVLDHGDGYMSLYGHNQALLKSVGDTVESGERIALMGQSGGQSRPALYFEIRHKGRAINPGKWLK